MRSGREDSLGREGFERSRSWRRDLREDRQAWERAPERDSGLPLRVRVSGGA